MSSNTVSTGLSGHTVVVPGGTGAIGEGVVRAYLDAGADVVVPTRSQARADEFTELLRGAPTEHLHLVVEDYSSFDAATRLAYRVNREFGAVDHVVAPIGGWWAGKPVWEIEESDWQSVFVGLATTHMAVVRAFLPRLSDRGSYHLIVGTSAYTPMPGSGLVSIEQAALLMMRNVLAAELGDRQRVFALVLGLMSTRLTGPVDPDAVTSDQVGAVAVAASSAPTVDGQEILLRGQPDVADALTMLTSSRQPTHPQPPTPPLTPRQSLPSLQ